MQLQDVALNTPPFSQVTNAHVSQYPPVKGYIQSHLLPFCFSLHIHSHVDSLTAAPLLHSVEHVLLQRLPV